MIQGMVLIFIFRLDCAIYTISFLALLVKTLSGHFRVYNCHAITADYTITNNNCLDGEYVEHSPGQIERCGSGTQHSKDGLVYSGKWENDKMNGDGK